MPSFAALRFDNSFARELPGLYVPWQPAAVPAPRLIYLNRPLAAELGLDVASLDGPAGAATFAGNTLPEGAEPLAQAYADIRDGEAWLNGLEISTYDQGNRANHEPMRPRKLLLHRREIDRLYGTIREKGLTIVPTRLYFKDSRVKIELAVARGKEQRDKRRDVVERDAKRQMERALKSRNR